MGAYSDPNSTVRREANIGEVGGGATTSYGKFRHFQRIKLKRVHAVVTVAGTVAGHKLDVYHGTTSIGTIALGTAAAEVRVSSGILNELVESLEEVSVKTGADATGKAHVVYEHEVQFDAVQTK